MNTRKIGKNRGKPRLWLEGSILINAGFNHGDFFFIDPLPDGLIIQKSQDGPRKIAGTIYRPIIDINSAAILSRFSSGHVAILNPKLGTICIMGVE